MSDRRGKKLADFFPLYFNILKVVEKRGDVEWKKGVFPFSKGLKKYLL